MTRNYHAETAESITALARRIMDHNLCKEIMLPASVYDTFSKTSGALKRLPVNKYKFSRSKWHTVDIGMGGWRLSREYNEIIEWCTHHFGPHPKKPDAWSRWWVGVGQIYFRDSKDYVLYQLRWSS